MVSISICFLHLVMHISVSCKSVFYYISYNIQREGYLEWMVNWTISEAQRGEKFPFRVFMFHIYLKLPIIFILQWYWVKFVVYLCLNSLFTGWVFCDIHTEGWMKNMFGGSKCAYSFITKESPKWNGKWFTVLIADSNKAWWRIYTKWVTIHLGKDLLSVRHQAITWSSGDLW